MVSENMEDINWHIGIVKFYDDRKGFGFIASNHCGMKSSTYEQDFYVDSSSFSDESAKSDRRIVVFQWEVQGRGKRRAFNVRNYSSKSEEDLELALNYYGDYEYVQLKEKRINMFNHLGVKRAQMLQLLKRQIESSPGSSPKEICERILHLVKKYKLELPENKRYIFSTDYDNEKKILWVDIFSLLKKEEWLRLLNSIPPVVLYLNDSLILEEWLKGLSVDVSSIDVLKDLQYVLPIIPDEYRQILKEKIEVAVNDHIESIIEKNRIDKSLLVTESSIFRKTRMERAIREYLPYTSRNFDSEILACKQQIKANILLSLIEEYKDSSTEQKFDEIIEAFKSIEHCDVYRDKVSKLIEDRILSFIRIRSYSRIFPLLRKVEFGFQDIVKATQARVGPTIMEELSIKIDRSIELCSRHDFEINFENRFSSLKHLLHNNVLEQFKQECRSKLLQSTSIDILVYAMESQYHWIEKEAAKKRIIGLIANWEFESIDNYIPDVRSFDRIPNFIKGVLADRTFQIISYDLSIPFSKTSKKMHDVGSSSVRHDNVLFLGKLKKLCISDELKVLWKNYINNLAIDDILILHHNEVVSVLPDRVISEVIANLKIDNATSKPENWYSVPVFRNVDLERIFSNTGNRTFEYIAARLKRQRVTKENMAMSVWLVELLAANKPDRSNYYEYKEWEREFSSKLQNLKAQTANDSWLSVLLWAIHLTTTSSSTALAEAFPWLPPYLQNRIVRRIFLYIAEGKMKFTAHTLYDLLSSSGEKLSLSLEILFSYLKLREVNPLATFTNTHMLTLIRKRNDHSEWTGIREFMEKCEGRWRVEVTDKTSNWRTPFYNGLLSKSQASYALELFIPTHMIDEGGVLQSYNNKYYNRIREAIELNFEAGAYTSSIVHNGIKYHFKENERIHVLYLARSYNIYIAMSRSTSKFDVVSEVNKEICECRLADTISRNENQPFYWCGNKPCFRPWIHFHTSEDWMKYTILDFMRILNIPIDYINKRGMSTKYGYFIFFSSFLQSFAIFYEHLKCRECGRLMHPVTLSNFANRSVTEFACVNDSCGHIGKTVYLNHCFNKPNCISLIDSRDSKKCPNGQFICPECGGCCSTGNFRQRISHLNEAGGVISPWIENFVRKDLGHWERNDRFCYKCGKRMVPYSGGFVCTECGVRYNRVIERNI